MISILIIIFIIFFFFLWNMMDLDKKKSIEDNKMIRKLITQMKSILKKSGFQWNKNISIVPSEQYSFTKNKDTIHLVLKDKQGHYFSNNTLLKVLIHEMAHLLCKSVDTSTHSKEFYDIEKKLISISESNHFITQQKIEKQYPCMRYR